MRLLATTAIAAVLALGACAPTAEPETADATALEVQEARDQQNIDNVIAFYNAAINDKDYGAAVAYIGDEYIQHNPVAADGKEGFEAFLGFLASNFPDSRSEVKNAWADGDYVILHVHSVREPGELGRAIVDIFRLDENGKVVEHWDVIQDIPAEPANDNTMF
jgi:predicted SnoaL-like aldol condensation-catalyzing enzyme